MSTLLLFFAAHVGRPPNNPWNPCALAHQHSYVCMYGLADFDESGINNQSQDELGFHRTFPHHKELWIHAAMLTMQS